MSDLELPGAFAGLLIRHRCLTGEALPLVQGGVTRHDDILRSLVGSVHPDDGVPTGTARRLRTGRHMKQRKLLGLCRQARDAIHLALPPDLDLAVARVEPDTNPCRLVVVFHAAHADVDLEDARARLARIKGLLRSEVARAITRKRVPDLVLRVSP